MYYSTCNQVVGVEDVREDSADIYYHWPEGAARHCKKVFLHLQDDQRYHCSLLLIAMLANALPCIKVLDLFLQLSETPVLILFQLRASELA
jgi:hypothetical protein